MISVGIIGGSGYTGKHLLQFCNLHPFIKDIKVYGHSTVGMAISKIFPDLLSTFPNMIVHDCAKVSMEHDAYFIALPHGEALEYVPSLLENGKLVIDLGGDYRLDDKETYEKWYRLEHTSPHLLSSKTYGLADYLDNTVYNNQLVANPGCYPTATLLGLLPLIKHFKNLIFSISTAAYSGTSGAGKAAKSEMLMSEMDGNVRAYNVNAHRHQPEIQQMLNNNGLTAPYSFTTHLLPVAVGIYVTSTVFMNYEIPESLLKKVYADAYESSMFVRMRDEAPNLRWVTNTNFCDINVSSNGKTVVITSAIDNLIKGAAGQAVQNLNKIYNWDENLGIIQKGVGNVSVYN